jgi:hypothetical protein
MCILLNLFDDGGDLVAFAHDEGFGSGDGAKGRPINLSPNSLFHVRETFAQGSPTTCFNLTVGPDAPEVIGVSVINFEIENASPVRIALELTRNMCKSTNHKTISFFPSPVRGHRSLGRRDS